jgi:hypothetical protein
MQQNQQQQKQHPLTNINLISHIMRYVRPFRGDYDRFPDHFFFVFVCNAFREALIDYGVIVEILKKSKRDLQISEYFVPWMTIAYLRAGANAELYGGEKNFKLFEVLQKQHRNDHLITDCQIDDSKNNKFGSTDEGFSRVVAAFPFLKTLRFYGVDGAFKLSDQGFQEGLSRLPFLRKLHLGGANLRPSTFGVIAGLTQLEGLSLISCDFRPAGFRQLSNLVNLESFFLFGSPLSVTEDVIVEVLGTFTKLQELHILPFDQIRDSSMPVFKNFPSLRILDLTEICFTIDGFPHIVENCKQLVELDLASDVTDEMLLLIAQNFPKLERLCLDYNRNITNEGVKHLGNYCQNLKTLGLLDCELITIDVLQYLLNLPKLEDVNLTYKYKISDKYRAFQQQLKENQQAARQYKQ